MQADSKRFTILLASIAALTSLSIDMSLPAIPGIERTFGVIPGRGSLTLSTFIFGYALMPPIGGGLADRFGRRPVLLTSLALFTLAALCCSFTSSFRSLVLFRFLQGCASGVSTTLPLAIIRDLLQGAEARQRMSQVTVVNNLMPIVAPVLGTWTMSQGNWRIVFGSQAGFGLALCMLLFWQLDESLSMKPRHRAGAFMFIRNYFIVFRDRTFLVHASVYSMTFASMFSFISLSPLILMQRLGVSRDMYTWFFIFAATGTTLGAILSGRQSREKIPAEKIILSGIACMFIATLIGFGTQLGGLHKPQAILPFVFFTLLGFGYAGPSLTVEAMEQIPHLAGSGSGALRSLFMSSGSVTSALLVYYCSEHPNHAEIATSIVMFSTTFLALAIYVALMSGTRLRRLPTQSPGQA